MGNCCKKSVPDVDVAPNIHDNNTACCDDIASTCCIIVVKSNDKSTKIKNEDHFKQTIDKMS